MEYHWKRSIDHRKPAVESQSKSIHMKIAGVLQIPVAPLTAAERQHYGPYRISDREHIMVDDDDARSPFRSGDRWKWTSREGNRPMIEKENSGRDIDLDRTRAGKANM
jgi:hypothetical protein